MSDATLSPQGQAYPWLKQWLPNTAPDLSALDALALPEEVRAAAFSNESSGHVYVRWACTLMDETATAPYSLPASTTATVHTSAQKKARASPASNRRRARLRSP